LELFPRDFAKEVSSAMISAKSLEAGFDGLSVKLKIFSYKLIGCIKCSSSVISRDWASALVKFTWPVELAAPNSALI